MLEQFTPEAIKAGILAQLSTDISIVEGSFLSDMVAAVSLEISALYGQLEKQMEIMFLDATENPYLDRKANEYGIIRRTGTRAEGIITVAGTVGATLPKGAIVVTDDGHRYETVTELTLATPTGNTVPITAEFVGADYNVVAEAVNTLQISYAGIQSVLNANALTGGTDMESDDSLKARVLERLQHPATSGNASHYKQWAREVDGVGDAKVTPLKNGAGTVEVLIVDDNRQSPASEVVTACAAHIESQRPIGATVTVVGATSAAVDVSASVTFDNSTTLEMIQAEFETELARYIRSIAFVDYTVSISRVGYLLLGIKGVVDYSNLKLNNNTGNVTIASTAVPVVGAVALIGGA